MSALFINVLDVAVFELYFPEKFLSHQLSVLRELASLEPFGKGLEQATLYYQILNDPAGAVKKAVYAINTIPEFKHIYNTLSNEDKKDKH